MPDHDGRLERWFTGFSSAVARWTGKHWTLTIVAVLVLVSLIFAGPESTNLGISIVTLLMVFVLQNTQNRDSAALHLKIDEIVSASPRASNHVRGVESKSEGEIKQLTRDDADNTIAAASKSGS
jgi:low affinity Fe/Cu permease